MVLHEIRKIQTLIDIIYLDPVFIAEYGSMNLFKVKIKGQNEISCKWLK